MNPSIAASAVALAPFVLAPQAAAQDRMASQAPARAVNNQPVAVPAIADKTAAFSPFICAYIVFMQMAVMPCLEKRCEEIQ